jgi:hypothetical protein
MNQQVPWPTQVPNQPNFVFGSWRDARGQWWIQIGCTRCQDIARKPCANPARTGYWVVVYIQQHQCGARP